MEHIFNPANQPAEGKRILHSRAAWAKGGKQTKPLTEEMKRRREEKGRDHQIGMSNVTKNKEGNFHSIKGLTLFKFSSISVIKLFNFFLYKGHKMLSYSDNTKKPITKPRKDTFILFYAKSYKIALVSQK